MKSNKEILQAYSWSTLHKDSYKEQEMFFLKVRLEQTKRYF